MARILLIDDDLSLRDVVSFILGGAGYAVTTATDGDAGVAAFDADPPDLVLTDLKMPGR
ncbi:response regulator, partial [bacterium]|nr:response regulator [bacterium]